MKEKPYILVVDDDPNIAKLEQLYLEKAGYEVKTVGRGDDAMTEFRKTPPDLMLLGSEMCIRDRGSASPDDGADRGRGRNGG
mgnify:CR=1 FL=1